MQWMEILMLTVGVALIVTLICTEQRAQAFRLSLQGQNSDGTRLTVLLACLTANREKCPADRRFPGSVVYTCR